MSPLLVVTLARDARRIRPPRPRTMDQAPELVLMIPPAEAARLAQVLGLTPAPARPSTGSSRTHDAGRDPRVRQHRCQPEGIRAPGATRDGQLEELGCHPADAGALTVRRYAPLVATPAALAHARPVDPPAVDEPLRVWLSRVTPDDFRDSGTEPPIQRNPDAGDRRLSALPRAARCPWPRARA